MTEAHATPGDEEVATAGRIGFASAVLVAVVLAAHPFGSTAIYAGGEAFLDHVGWFSVAIHLVATAGLLVWPGTLAVWARNLATTEARVVGQMAVFAVTLGVGVGAFHLIAVDTVVFELFRPTFEAAGGSDAAVTALDLLVRFHAASLVAWAVTLYIGTPTLLAWASARDGRMPSWSTGLLAVAALIAAVSVAITLVEGQWTTLSEQVLFRLAATLIIAWMVLTTYRMWKDERVGVM